MTRYQGADPSSWELHRSYFCISEGARSHVPTVLLVQRSTQLTESKNIKYSCNALDKLYRVECLTRNKIRIEFNSVAAGKFEIWWGTNNVPYIEESLGHGLNCYSLYVKNWNPLSGKAVHRGKRALPTPRTRSWPPHGLGEF